jgi:low-affinity ferrous iron transport protein
MQALAAAAVEEAPAQRQPGCASWLTAGIHAYARFMSSLGGLLLSLALLGLWLGLGAAMGYDNPNWWLIIGTYTGLVGFALCSMPCC